MSENKINSNWIEEWGKIVDECREIIRKEREDYDPLKEQ